MAKRYRLKKDGQIVNFMQWNADVSGTSVPMTRSKVGRAGESFGHLSPALIAQIEAGELEDTWEIYDNQAEAESTPVQEATTHKHGDEEHGHAMDFVNMSSTTLQEIADAHQLNVEGSGPRGRVSKSDLVTALESIH